MSTIVYRLKELVAIRGNDETPITRLLFDAAIEIERLQAQETSAVMESETMAAHCRTIEDALGIGCVEDAVDAIKKMQTQLAAPSCEGAKEDGPGGVCGKPATHTMSDRPYCSECAARLSRYWDGVEPITILCACVSHDAITCATMRDNLDPDDRDFGRRSCDCCCHEKYEQDE